MNGMDEDFVTTKYLHRVLTKINRVLQLHAQAIANLQNTPQETDTSQAYQNANRILQIEVHLGHIRDELSELRQMRVPPPETAPVQQVEHEDLSPQIRDLEKRLSFLENLEKKEEYDQTNLERDFELLQREFETAQRQIKDMRYQLRKLR